MLKVKTKLGTSGVHGIGLFADQFIPKDTVTWEYDPKFDIGFEPDVVDSLPPISKAYFLHYCYLDKELNMYILCCDNQRFINHSISRENILSTPKLDRATRDIQEGEEFFCNYNKFDDSYFVRMGISPENLIN